MTEPTSTPAPPTAPQARRADVPPGERVSLRVLWYGIFGAPLLWSVQIIVGYAVLAHTCFPESRPLPAPRSGAPWWITVVLSIGGIILGLGAVRASVRARRTPPMADGGGSASARADPATMVRAGRTRFMATAGILLSTLFTAGIALNTIALFIVPPCG